MPAPMCVHMLTVVVTPPLPIEPCVKRVFEHAGLERVDVELISKKPGEDCLSL